MNIQSQMVAMLLLSTAVGTACAMTCAVRPPTAAVADYEHIFVAQLKSAALSEDKAAIEATFEVEEVLKGRPDQVSTIRTSFDDHNYATKGALIASIEVNVSPGMHLLVFANGNGPANFGACSDTIRLRRHDAPMLEFVRKTLLLR